MCCSFTVCAAAPLHGMCCSFNVVLCELQVDIVPREERDDAAMMPRVPQPMSGAMAGKFASYCMAWHCTALHCMLCQHAA